MQDRGELFIRQPYERYSKADHQTWATLYSRLLPRWREYANEHFLHGVEALALPPDRIPRLEEINAFLSRLTGFQAVAVSGYVPAFVFFDCLRRREFPTTVTIRPPDRLDYLPEPDIFHDVAGHVPMHTDPAFAEALVRFGDCAHTAAEIAGGDRDLGRLGSIVRAMARFFWFTVEFGLMRSGDRWKAYGSGLLSSYGELEHAVASPEVQRYPVQLEWVVNQPFEIDRYQPLLFLTESFEHLFELTGQLERWMREGRLDNVAPGQPEIQLDDLKSFVAAESAQNKAKLTDRLRIPV
jgi:phenylalanine-4-hydroxylase